MYDQFDRHLDPEHDHPLSLYITTSSKPAIDAITFAVRHIRRAVDTAARELAKHRADWHDDPEGDPKGFAEHHAPADQQFPAQVRDAVAYELFCHYLDQFAIDRDYNNKPVSAKEFE